MKYFSAFTVRLLAFVFICILTNGAYSQVSGLDTPGMAVYDTIFQRILQKWNIPGATVAVVHDGSLVFAHGYGTADSAAGTSVQPYSRFRIASLSKAIASAGVLRLYEQGKLHLDDSIFTILNDFQPYKPSTVDPRIYSITLRELLQHTGGWDRNISGDPLFEERSIAASIGATPPANDTDIIRFMMSQTLDHNPGTVYAYSNFGYMLLGRAIEHILHVRYRDYAKDWLTQAGISRIAQGHSLLSQQQQDEVAYYDYPGSPLATNVFTGAKVSVPAPYGGFVLENNDVSGAWISSSIDYLRFMTSVDNRPSRPDVLKSATIDTMISRPFAPVNYPGDASWYGMGWSVRPEGNDANWWHDGGLPGTNTWMVRESEEGAYCWVAFFNSRPTDPNFEGSLDSALWVAHETFASEPAYNLFAPVPLDPMNGATSIDPSAQLRWYYPDRTDAYHVQISKASDFSSTVFDDSTIQTSSLQLPVLQTNTTYYWRIRQVDSIGIGEMWSPASSFTMGSSSVVVGAPEELLQAFEFPNPAQTRATIEYTLSETAPVSLELYDLLGTKLLTKRVSAETPGTHSFLVNTGNLSDGIYLYIVESAGHRVTGTLQVIR